MSGRTTDSETAPFQTSLASFGTEAIQSTGPTKTVPTAKIPSGLTIHEQDLDTLLGRGGHARRPTDLVLAPVAIHRRTLKHRFVCANEPRDTLRLTGPVDVAFELVTATNDSDPEILDRVDRIPLLEQLLQENPDARNPFRQVLGKAPATAVNEVEQARTRIETVTGYHPRRVSAIREWGDPRQSTEAADIADQLEGTLAIEEHLREETEHATSKESLVRRATRNLVESDGRAWRERYPSIERLWLCGLSTLSVTMTDFIAAILATTDVEVHLHTRHASGPLHANGLPGRFDVEQPGAEVYTDR